MTMPIDGPKPSTPQISTNGPRTSAGRTPGGPPGTQDRGAAGGDDAVQLTPVAENMSALARSLADGPPVDTQRIEAITRAIDEGRYQVDPARVAQGLLDMEQALDG